MESFLTCCSRLMTVHLIGAIRNIRIDHGYCTVTNNRLTYSKFFEELSHLDITVDCKKFISAAKSCKYDLSGIRQTEHNLIITKGKFRAQMNLQNAVEFPIVTQDLKYESLGLKAFEVLKKLRPFASTDASRPWSCSILFDTRYAHATNNVIISRVPFVTPRSFALPIVAFDEILRASESIVGVGIGPSSVRFTFANGMVLTSSLMADPWPDLDKVYIKSNNPPAVHPELKEAIEYLVPLCDGMRLPKITFCKDGVKTQDGTTSAEYSGIELPEGYFHAVPLLEVLKVATHIDFSMYPKACYFKGEDIDGMIVGMR